jgi:hypothetical protein
MAAWVYKIVMLPGNVVPCGFYKNVSNYVVRLFVRLVNDVTFVAQARKPGLDMLRAALAAPHMHPLFRWLLDTIEGFKAREPEWQDRAEVWKWFKEGLYRPMMAVLIMATVGYDFDKAEALWGKTQRDLLHSAFFRVDANHRTAECRAVGLRGNASPSAPPLSQRSLKGERARALLREAGRPLAIDPVFLLGMAPGATVAAITAAHIKKSEAGGGCMAGLHGGNTITGRTDEQHVDACAAGGASMAGLHGGNTITGRTDEQHDDAIAGPVGAAWRASAEATPSREGPTSSTRRRYPVAYNPHWVRTPSTSCLATGTPCHGHGSPVEAGRVSNVIRATPPHRRASNEC